MPPALFNWRLRATSCKLLDAKLIIMRNIKTILAVLLIPLGAVAQEKASENLQKTFHFTNPQAVHVIYVENIQGAVSIEGYKGTDVTVEVAKTIEGKTKEKVAQGMSEMDLGVWQSGDSVAVYMENKNYTRFSVHHGEVDYSYMDCCCNRGNRDTDYNPTFTFTVKVPVNSAVTASTVNDGDVTIAGVHGMVSADNVNGAIAINDVHQVMEAMTVNGNVTITYGPQPVPGGSFKTINGDININFPQLPDTEVTFKTMNGDLYTNVDKISLLKPEVTKVENKDENSTTYKIEKVTPVQIGKGGTRMTFETLNGDVTIKKL